MSWIIRLQRLPLSANASDIRSFFAGLRIPDGAVHIVGGPEGDAFIGFATDEDARQAMRYNDRRIHDQRVHLLLSSRVEMECVIAKARSGDLGAASSFDQLASQRVATAGVHDDSQMNMAAAAAAAAQAVGTRSSDSFTNNTTDRNAQHAALISSSRSHNTNNSNNNNIQATSQQSLTDIQQRQQSDFTQQQFNRGENAALWGRTAEMVNSMASSQIQSDSWKNSASGNSFDSRSCSTAVPSSRHSKGGTSQQQPASITPWQDAKMLNILSQNNTNSLATPSNAVYHQQSARDEHYDTDTSNSNFQGYKASLQPTTVTSTSNVFAQRSQIYQQSGLVAPPLIPGQQLQMPPSIPGLVMPPMVPPVMPPVASALASTLVSASNASGAAASLATANPFAGVFSHQNAPIFPPVPIQRAVKQEINEGCCYVELSRLPSELVSPAALEQFLKPSIPLTLSSVKVVFDPKGQPLHALVRFESAQDAENILNRDGERGIRIRPCSRETFDKTVDGSVMAPTDISNHSSHERGRSRNRDPSSSRPNSSSRRRHSPDPRRDLDSRRDIDHDHRSSQNSRSRTPPAAHRTIRRRSSRSPIAHRDIKRRKDEQPDRYCIEFSNLPFRVTEPEIRNFLGPRCEPVKVSRAFKEDAQASDRWILEFSSIEFAERAYRTRGSIQDRTVRSRRLTNDEADALLSIPDKFGYKKKEEFERKHGASSSFERTTDVLPSSGESNSNIMPPTSMNGSASNDNKFGAFPSRQDRAHHSASGPPSAPHRDNYSGRGRGGRAGPPRPFGPGMDYDSMPPNRGMPLIGNGPAGGFTMNGPSNMGGLPSQRFCGGPRAPLIRPPSFFGATPASTIRQRGPPPSQQQSNSARVKQQAVDTSSSHHHSNGSSRSSLGISPSKNDTKNNTATTSLPSSSSTTSAASANSKQTSCLLLQNISSTLKESDIVQLLAVNASRINSTSIRRLSDGKVYVDLGDADDAKNAFDKFSRLTDKEKNNVQISLITHQKMVEDIQHSIDQKELDPELVASLGEPGTVISCHGFPPDVTIMDVAQFFDKFSLVESSVRIKLDDDGISTGECLLAVGTPQEAAKAVLLLSGRRLNGSTVTMSVVEATSKQS
ncbi:unnamed protein product [Anisakis simplex]|uniref:RRM domain-containing protein n=1 Tax=Anisakis simplex TaxID=6269 RepID=A0A158PN44_ANISI|nr:unnamed protein product [Anisakis simplex]